MKKVKEKICYLLTDHNFERVIATDWTKTKVVSTPICMNCGVDNKNYDFENEDNKFYLKHWDLYRKENIN